jgi:hypothetical protein
MLAVIALGMVHISANSIDSLELLLIASPSVSEADDFDHESLASIDIAIDAELVSPNVIDDSLTTIGNEEYLPNLDADWLESANAANGTDLSATGLGDLSGLGNEISTNFGEGHSYTSLFGVSGEGKKFVYVFDRSASMNSVFTLYSEGRPVSMITPLLSAKQELIRSLNSLSSKSEFQIVFYNDSPFLFGKSHYANQLYQANDEHKSLARTFIEQMPGQGFTNHLSALEAGISLEPDVIFLLTDAEAKDDLQPELVRRMANYCERHNIVINVVHFCNVSRPESTLVWLAESTGGKHIFISLESLAESMINPASF